MEVEVLAGVNDPPGWLPSLGREGKVATIILLLSMIMKMPTEIPWVFITLDSCPAYN